MSDTILIFMSVGLAILLGYVIGFAWRGSNLRRSRKARKEALSRAAQNFGRDGL